MIWHFGPHPGMQALIGPPPKPPNKPLKSWFMAFMFFVSGVFSAPSYDSKGPRRFFSDRALRLLAPLALYDLLLQPLAFAIARGSPAAPTELAAAPGGGFSYYYATQFTRVGHGAAWFVAVLFVFDLAYCASRVLGAAFQRRSCCGLAQPPKPTSGLSRDAELADHDDAKTATSGATTTDAATPDVVPPQQTPFSARATLAIVLCVAAATAAPVLLVRLALLYPLGLPTFMWLITGLQFQPAYLPQYAVAFALGPLAHRTGAPRRLPPGAGPACGAAAAALAALGAAGMAFFPGSDFGAAAAAAGRGSAGYIAAIAVWEQLYAVCVCVALLVGGRQYANRRGGAVGAAVCGAAYAVYIIHVPVLTVSAASG